MTSHQALAFALLGGMIALFVWDKLRYDLVALVALSTGLLVGLVPFDGAFRGFSDPVVVVVAAALVVSAAIEKCGIAERLVMPLASRLKSPDALAATLVALVTVLSAFMKNVGALAIFIPVAVRLARRNNSSPSLLLMPLAFGSLIGGLMTLIGTSPNIIVSRVRTELTGKPFAMFDYFPVGAGIALCGVAFLAFGWRLLPKERKGKQGSQDHFRIEDYLAEVRVRDDSPIIDSTVADLETLFSQGAVAVAAIIRDRGQSYVPDRYWKFLAGDILVLECDPVSLKPLLDTAGLELVHGNGKGERQAKRLSIAEAVVMPSSPLVGSTLRRNAVRSRHGVAALAVSRGGRDYATRLHEVEFRVGDVVVVEGPDETLGRSLADLGCLPLAQRNLHFSRRPALPPLLILTTAMVLIAFGVVPVAVGFFAAAVAMVLSRSLSLQEAHEAINWPIILMLGALIPVSDAVNHSGASELVAGWLAQAIVSVPPPLAITLVMLTSMLLAPFLHHAATVLVMGPVAASMAIKLGLSIDPFLMAVAVGAGSDFLTPIGHQCNTLVMGPGGYRFGDYWRMGLPLSIMVLVVGTLLVVTVWPL
ncbi:MAG: SLC13 family permease [Rhodospirillales bacterium]|nr:SLC13 family permease [Rhodospirillales bacterium]